MRCVTVHACAFIFDRQTDSAAYEYTDQHEFQVTWYFYSYHGSSNSDLSDDCELDEDADPMDNIR
jgi:hypothetical protein